jgi:hypothetical protein
MDLVVDSTAAARLLETRTKDPQDIRGTGKNQVTSFLKKHWLITESFMNNARFFEVVETTRTEGSLILLFLKNPSGTYQLGCGDLPIQMSPQHCFGTSGSTVKQ